MAMAPPADLGTRIDRYRAARWRPLRRCRSRRHGRRKRL